MVRGRCFSFQGLSDPTNIIFNNFENIFNPFLFQACQSKWNSERVKRVSKNGSVTHKIFSSAPQKLQCFSGEASERHEGPAQRSEGPKADEFQVFFGADVVLEVTIVRFFSCAYVAGEIIKQSFVPS